MKLISLRTRSDTTESNVTTDDLTFFMYLHERGWNRTEVQLTEDQLTEVQDPAVSHLQLIVSAL